MRLADRRRSTSAADSLKVLVIDEDLCWPLTNGKKIRTYNLLRRLAERHRIAIVAYAGRDSSEEARVHLESLSIEVHDVPVVRKPKSGIGAVIGAIRSGVTGRPYSVSLIESDCLQKKAREVAISFKPDLIHAEITPLAGIALSLGDLPKVLNAHNYEAKVWVRLAAIAPSWVHRIGYQSQAFLMNRFEHRILNEFDAVCAVSDVDIDALRVCNPAGRYNLIPNGVDLSYYIPESAPAKSWDMVLTGALDWRPMQDAVRFFIEAIFPRVRRLAPQMTAAIVGRCPPIELQELIRRTNGMTLFQNVPDVRPFVTSSSVSVVPLRSGSGSRLKILESMALERPVVSTTVGAEGLDVAHDVQILIADDPDGFASTVVRICDDRLNYERIASAARRFVERQHNWDAIAIELDHVWGSAARRSS